MEKDVLFSIPLFRGKKNKKIFKFNNFRQAMQAIVDENLFYVEYYADINFYIDKCQEVRRPEIKRIYLADIKPYKELWYRAVNDKWLKVPQDFMYDKKYQNQKFLFSQRAREIAIMPQEEFIALQEQYLQALKGEISIQLKKDEQILNDALPVQKDIECSIGDGILFKNASKNKDFQSALTKLRQQPNKFISISINMINFKFDGTIKCIKNVNIYAEEDKISTEEALKKSHYASGISKIVAQGTQNFVYNKKHHSVIPALNALFVPKNTILNKWTF